MTRQQTGRPDHVRPRLECLETRELLNAAFSLGSTGFDTAYSVKLDNASNQYVCGTFIGTVDFDPGPGTRNLFNADSTDDAFLAKYSPTGQLLWVGQLVNCTASALTLDASGNVLLTGSFPGTTDFDFGPGTTPLSTGTASAGYVAKYTSDGAIVWARRLGGQTSFVSGDTIVADAAGNVYSSGVMSNGTADMDPGPGTFNLTNTSGNADTYISKLDSSGNFVWAKKFSNDPAIAAGVWPEDMGVDGSQNVYISGIFVGRVNFDTSGGTRWVTTADGAAGYGDAYVARLTAAGNLDYIATMGSATGRDDGNGIAVDSAGNAYVTGAFLKVSGQQPSPLVITPATGSGAQLTLAPAPDPLAANSDLFVLKLNPAGGLDWARSIGGCGSDGGQSIAIGPDGLYLTGFFNGTVDFDPNAGVHNVTGAGGFTDVFILKLGTDASFSNVWNVGGTDFEFGNDIAVNSAGNVSIVGRFQGSGEFDPGPGTITLTSAGSSDAFVVLMSQPNRPPVAASQSVTTNEDTPVSGTVTATDPDGDPLTFAVVAGPAHGTLVLNGSTGAFTYTPAPDYNGPDSVTFKANDGQVDSNVATISITVTPVNDAPVAQSDSYTTAEDTALTVPGPGVLANDTDVDGDPLHAVLVSGPSHGTLALNSDGSFSYTPAPNYNGSDSFSYRASDGSLSSNLATVSLTITAVNDAPVAVNDSYTMVAGNVLQVPVPGVLGNDSDVDGDALTALLVSGPAHGALSFSANGSFTYTPADGYSGSDSFTYRASDGSLDALATVTLTVNPATAPATTGMVSGNGSIDGGARRFNLSVQSRDAAGSLAFSGLVTFQDIARGLSLQSTSITYLRQESDDVRATIRGTATVNGVAGFTFTVFVEDNGEPGRNDKFRIVISGPGGFTYDSADFALQGGLLESGNIQVHKK